MFEIVQVTSRYVFPGTVSEGTLACANSSTFRQLAAGTNLPAQEVFVLEVTYPACISTLRITADYLHDRRRHKLVRECMGCCMLEGPTAGRHTLLRGRRGCCMLEGPTGGRHTLLRGRRAAACWMGQRRKAERCRG